MSGQLATILYFSATTQFPSGIGKQTVKHLLQKCSLCDKCPGPLVQHHAQSFMEPGRCLKKTIQFTQETYLSV
jgi:hypothetical protein